MDAVSMSIVCSSPPKSVNASQKNKDLLMKRKVKIVYSSAAEELSSLRAQEGRDYILGLWILIYRWTLTLHGGVTCCSRLLLGNRM
jgi:hypothetical protein